MTVLHHLGGNTLSSSRHSAAAGLMPLPPAAPRCIDVSNHHHRSTLATRDTPRHRCHRLAAANGSREAEQPAVSLPKRLAASAAAVAVATAISIVPASVPEAATASDMATVGTCLLSKCQAALEGCLGDAKCLQSLVCLQSCAGTPDETACQIRCGDLYAGARLPFYA